MSVIERHRTRQRRPQARQAAKRNVGRRKSKPCKGKNNEMATTANCPSSFRHRGVTTFSHLSESQTCSPTPNNQSVLHQAILQLHRRLASLESNLSSGISANLSRLTMSSPYSGTAAHLSSTTSLVGRRLIRLFQQGVVADRSRLQEGYRSMGRGEGKFQGARKRAGS